MLHFCVAFNLYVEILSAVLSCWHLLLIIDIQNAVINRNLAKFLLFSGQSSISLHNVFY